MTNGNLWTDERTEQLKQLWTKGLSCSQIALEIGYITRNAVIGKASRLGLEARKPRFNAQRATRKRIKERFPQRRRTISFERIDAEPFVPKAAELLQPPLNVSFLDLTFDQCRYPVTDTTPFAYCGHPQTIGSSYCGPHHRISYTTPRRLNLTEAQRERRRHQGRNNLNLRKTFVEAAE